MSSPRSAPRPDQRNGAEGNFLDEVYAQVRRQGVEAGAEALRDDLQLQGERTWGDSRPLMQA
jgi:hypothetical protein